MSEINEISIRKRIINWSKERNIMRKTEYKKEASFILEELIEGLTGLESKKANIISNELINDIQTKKVNEPTEEELIDSFADIIVFSIGAIEKMGYNSDEVLDEVLKTIESREGEIIDGKFVKYTDEKFTNKWYKADLKKTKYSKYPYNE